MSLEDRMKDEFMAGLEEGFAGVPMEFPEGIRPLGEFHREIGVVEVEADQVEPGAPLVSPDRDDEVIDAEVLD